ncbi:hypothetical protein [Lactiplantibacillus plantarum]|uniref:hypothetical protein n=1 Tax=Lactiplantibacillus plantarum TaxID=1590 RepID=UPI0009780D7C|nr:hypothetical protein [Lactiplantibacillus plantarum]
MKMTLSRLRYKASLNKLDYEELSNGNTIDVNTKLFDFYYGYYKQSLSQSISSNAFDYLKDKVTIIARHDDRFVTAMNDQNYTITLPNAETYNVTSINPDYEVNGYDTIVLSLVGGSSDDTTSDSATNTDTNNNG